MRAGGKNLKYKPDEYRNILTQIYVFLVLFSIFHFDPEKLISKNCKYIYFYQKLVHLGENTLNIVSDNCSSCSCNFFFKVHQACHNIANGIKPGSNSKKSDIAQKLYVWA